MGKDETENKAVSVPESRFRVRNTSNMWPKAANESSSYIY